MSDGIVFQVETSRVLRILSREIYDSPLALLRENVQNAYDAVRMRFARSGVLEAGGRIDVTVSGTEISIADNGVGMTEAVLRNNFWKAGSSGKQSELAQKAGVVGTFGIGAMANFGVCKRLTVETRAEDSTEVLRSTAERDSLKIGEECIVFLRGPADRDVGTTVTALLDEQYSISSEQAKQYLDPYIAVLPVPVSVNGSILSENTIESRLPADRRSVVLLGSQKQSDGLCAGTFDIAADPNGQVLVRVSDVSLGGNAVDGSVTLLQRGGPLMGFRSYFGLAPVPAIGSYQFGGFANLSFLQPTAGREALTRESIEQVTRLVSLAERVASELLASTPHADNNTDFLQWLIAHGRYELAARVSIHAFPQDRDLPLADVPAQCSNRVAHYYTGTDQQILRTFANETACLLQVAQSNPRRRVQLHYVRHILGIQEVPDSAQVMRVYKASELNGREAAVLVRIASILREDYLVPAVDVALAEISHGVTVLPQQAGDQLILYVARSSALLPPLYEFYDRAYHLFTQFMKDFVRIHIYSRIQKFVPSSTRDGVDALRKILQRNRELYRYEETERGDLEGILGDYLAGNVSLNQVVTIARSTARAQSQTVSPDQVGTIEIIVPDVVASPVAHAPAEGMEFAPSPPIIRDDVVSDMKILTTREKYRQLNNFSLLLGLSDRLMQTDGDFFLTPHTTRIIWGGHRVIYIFTEATGRLSLYYDIELHEPIEHTKAGGGMFPTTTLITKKRIFVPVPDAIADEFKIATGSKEFFVRFDVLSSDVA